MNEGGYLTLIVVGFAIVAVTLIASWVMQTLGATW